MKNSYYYDEMYATREKYKCSYSESKYYPLWIKLLSWLNKAEIKSVLDIGCGTAQLGRMLMDNKIAYSGFDYSSKAMEIAKGFGVSTWVGTVDDAKNYIPVDAYLCMEVLEHLENDLGVFRLLSKNSFLFFSVPTFKHESHVRRFKTESSVRKRYSVYFTELTIKQIGKRFLCKGRLL